jgi:hypothetical protein
VSEIHTRKRRAIANDPPERPEAERLLNSMMNLQEVLAEQSSGRLRRDLRLRIDSDRPVGIVFAADLHLGGRGTDHPAVMRWLKRFEASGETERHGGLFCYLGGDVVDNYVIPKLAHAARDGHVVPPDAQWELVRYLIERLLATEGLLCVGTGNHDAWTHRMAGIDGHLSALRDLPLLYTGEGGYLDLSVGDYTWTIYRKHRPGFSSRYNPSHAARQALRFSTRLADIVVIEHQHEPSVEKAPMFGKPRIFIRTGTAKVSDTHAEEFGFNHSLFATPTVVLDPRTGIATPFFDMEEALAFLNGGPANDRTPASAPNTHAVHRRRRTDRGRERVDDGSQS